MKKIYFAIALHFHQPTGNFEHILDRAYKFCYLPFLELFSQYPQLKMTFHISGCLLDYLDNKHPQIIKLLRCLARQRQIEIMGGGYYEPILPALSEEDILGQIKMMSENIKQKFKVTPQGIWIPERVWDPALTKLIYKTGLRYCILDDEHLLRSGLKQPDLHGYFLTGQGKEKLAVFPSSKQLRYLIPFKPVQEIIDYFKRGAENNPGALFTYGDDGEKFGEWPGTYNWVFENHWLSNFLNALEQNKDWLELVRFSDYLKHHQASSVLPIEPGSYHEMMLWSDNCWMNFLSKYPEANQMHKKMMYVSSKISRLKKQIKPSEIPKLELAKKHLYLGQCNCAYWHGVFGGLYLYHLRRAVYKHLIEAEKIADKLLGRNKKNRAAIMQQLDFNLDGKNEVIIETENFSICLEPHEGGIIKELDYKPLSFNLINTLSRKKEPYHQKILDSVQPSENSKAATIHGDFRTVDPSFKNLLIYDKFSRGFLRSYFVKKNLKFQDFMSSSYEELGDFSTANYAVKEKNNRLFLQHSSAVSNTTLTLHKQIHIKSKNEIEIACFLKKEKPAGLKVQLGIEFNLTMPDLNSQRYHYCFAKDSPKSLNSYGQILSCSSFGILDTLKKFNLCFKLSKEPDRIWYYPVKTISQSEKAYELNYQCSCIFILYDLKDISKENSFNINLIFAG